MHYEVIERRASAAALHGLQVDEPAQAEIWSNRVTAPALVLGSTQREADVVDRAACVAAGVEVVRRRSGGGAVLLVPGEVTWIDVVVPTGASGWAHDVHVPMTWIGEHLASIVRDLLDGGDVAGPAAPTVTVNTAGMVTTSWSATVCFDGLGPGEVSLDGKKLIGISQRRTRAAARLQCSWYHAYDPAALVGLLAPGRRPTVGELRPVATLDASASAAVPALLQRRLGTEGAASIGAPRGDPGA